MKTYNRFKATVLLAISTLFVISASSCKKDTVDNEPIVYGDAKLRVVNAVPGSNAQDFYQGDTKVSTTPIAFGEVSPYLTIKAGNSIISYRNTGTTTVTANASLGLYTNDSYTIFYVNNGSGSGAIIGFQDDLVAPATGKAKVRFVNIGLALTNVIDVKIAGGASLATGLQYGRGTTYSTIDANTELSAGLGTLTPVSVPASTFQSGKTYTVWFEAVNSTTINYHVIQQN